MKTLSCVTRVERSGWKRQSKATKYEKITNKAISFTAENCIEMAPLHWIMKNPAKQSNRIYPGHNVCHLRFCRVKGQSQMGIVTDFFFLRCWFLLLRSFAMFNRQGKSLLPQCLSWSLLFLEYVGFRSSFPSL